jgi:hypothetical protein
VTCLRDKSGLISVVEKIWYGTIGRADIALTFFEDGRVSLTFFGDRDDHKKDFSPAENAMARSTFEAIGRYLNDKLREPEWQAQLIRP